MGTIATEPGLTGMNRFDFDVGEKKHFFSARPLLLEEEEEIDFFFLDMKE